MEAEARIETRSLSDGTATVVVAVDGELDMGNAPEFESKLKMALECSSGSVLVDLTRCGFIDSTTLRVLTHAHVASEGRLSVIAPDSSITKVLEISHLDRVFNVYPDTASALDGHARADSTRDHPNTRPSRQTTSPQQLYSEGG